MRQRQKRKSINSWRGKAIPRGECSDVFLPVSESYSGISLKIPIRIQRGVEDGPVVFLTAALHGDELNGTGAIRELLCDHTMQLQRGALILVPILNLLAFDRHSRYLPDRRDLNRCFPGSANGSLAGRIARQIFGEIVARADLGIDLHTAAVRRTNYPNIRADMTNPLAQETGYRLRRRSDRQRGRTRRLTPTRSMPRRLPDDRHGRGGSMEGRTRNRGHRGSRHQEHPSCAHMIEGEVERPDTQVVIQNAKWVRADRGGFLQFHVRPGQVIEKDQPLATNTDLLGREQALLIAPFGGVIIGMTTLPAVSPGEPVCHIGQLTHDTLASDIRESRSETQSLEKQTVKDLASNVLVFERESDDDPPPG